MKNWIKHNRANSPKVKKCIEKELEKVKCREFVDMFFDACEEYGYSIDTLSKDYGEKEKEKQKEKYKEKQKQKEKYEVLEDERNYDEKVKSISKFKLLYEQNVGLINGVVAQWLFEVSETIDYELFKRAIEIATDRGKCNKGYINGIINQWNDNNINSINDLSAYEVGVKNRGENGDGKYKYESSKSKYARELEEEDESIYQKPSEEQLEQIRREFGR